MSLPPRVSHRLPHRVPPSEPRLCSKLYFPTPTAIRRVIGGDKDKGKDNLDLDVATGAGGLGCVRALIQRASSKEVTDTLSPQQVS